MVVTQLVQIYQSKVFYLVYLVNLVQRSYDNTLKLKLFFIILHLQQQAFCKRLNEIMTNVFIQRFFKLKIFFAFLTFFNVFTFLNVFTFIDFPELQKFSQLLARHQFTLQDHRYGASASRGVPVYGPAFTGSHCAHQRRNGQAGLNRVPGYIPGWFTCLLMVTHASSNRTRR